MPGPLQVSNTVVIPEAELTWRFSRSSGPGGQGVNTTDSRVELSFDLATTTALSQTQRERALERLADRLVDGQVTIAASEFRSQLRNREAAMERLAELIRQAIAPPPKQRKATKPSKRAKQRRLDAKKRRGDIKRLRRGDTDLTCAFLPMADCGAGRYLPLPIRGNGEVENTTSTSTSKHCAIFNARNRLGLYSPRSR